MERLSLYEPVLCPAKETEVKMETILELDAVTKSFGGLRVTSGVSFSVAKGSISAIIGPNGAGKTSLFNEITGYLKPDSGRIIFDGENTTDLSTREIVAAVWAGPSRLLRSSRKRQHWTMCVWHACLD